MKSYDYSDDAHALDAHNLGDTLIIEPIGPLSGSVMAPGSKSVTNRILILAALAEGTSTVINPLISDDSAAMLDVIRQLGAVVDTTSDSQWLVTGLNGGIGTVDHTAQSNAVWPNAAESQLASANPDSTINRDNHAIDQGTPDNADLLTVEQQAAETASVDSKINCRLSGTTIRFASAMAALSTAPITLGGLPPLERRPIGPLMQALAQLGATVKDRNGLPPVTVYGGLAGGTIDIDASGSSQYVSAIMLAAPYAQQPITLNVTGEHASAYLDLTVQALQTFGADVQVSEQGNVTRYEMANRGLRATSTAIEFDASAAAHLWGIAMTTGGTVTVTNATPTAQGDIEILDVFESFGGRVTKNGNAITVEGPVQPESPGIIDITNLPDQITTLSAVAAVARGTTTLVGASVVRGHEVDRIHAIATEFAMLGIPVEELPDGLIITGVEQIEPRLMQTYHDHRMAMSFAALGLRLPGVTLVDPACVDKTFPTFFSVVRSLK